MNRAVLMLHGWVFSQSKQIPRLLNCCVRAGSEALDEETSPLCSRVLILFSKYVESDLLLSHRDIALRTLHRMTAIEL